ncbi:MAG: response regulator [Candidatus Latescibacteria bacterium]|nr:response regulator [Candidatus Latescibacterota bacterium]
MKILIAEDDLISRRILQITLTNWGYDVVVTTNGTDAWRALQGEDAPELAILDWMMPGLNGVEIARKVRESSKSQTTYILLLTAKTEKEDLVAGLRAGADGYITKPFDPEELRERVQVGVRIAELQSRLASRVRELEEAFSRIRRTENELRFLSSAVEQSSEGITIADLEGKLLFVNQAWSQMHGYETRDELIGRHFKIFHTQEQLVKYVTPFNQKVMDEESHTGEVGHIRKDGTPFSTLTTTTLLKDETGKPIAMIGIARDNTERKRLEGQLAQEQKLASVGQLAAGIAHEINTPIQYVGDNTRFFQESFNDISNVLEKYHRLLEATKAGAVPQELVEEMETAFEEADIAFLLEEIPTAIEQSLEGVDRVTKIVQAMRAFAHPGVSEKTSIDLNKAIESTITVARNEWKYVAEMETDFDSDLPLVPCLPDEFNQVILNIVLNAACAIADIVGDGSEGKGIITVSTRRKDDWAEIRIHDTGTGIPERVRSKVFDPFFTTKEVGKGTGQGLAIAHNVVVQKHGGTITFETETGKGTTFIIRLPIENESG